LTLGRRVDDLAKVPPLSLTPHDPLFPRLNMRNTTYFIVNTVKNALASVLIPLHRSRGSLGLDGNIDRAKDIAGRVVAHATAAGIELKGASVLELGPGRTPDTAAIMRSWGAADVLALDTDLQIGAADIEEAALRSGWLGNGRTSPISNLKFAQYDGCNINRPNETFDLIYSKSVLEHVRHDGVEALLGEMTRCLKRNGVMVHIVDLRDHMFIFGDDLVTGNWLKALEFSEKTFDRLFSNRSTYINRLRSSEWRSRFDDQGLDPVHWDEHRIPLDVTFDRSALDQRWHGISDEELRVAWLTIVARKPA
jgi:ubiquinone/menaquinone biosynthesis C-methylase UbiE